MKDFSKEFQRAAEIVAGADALVIAAGAGMGVDSGLPDFRGQEGFWKAYPALAKAQLDFTEVASPRTFERDPALAWGFYGHRLKLYRETVPHAGFGILRGWSDAMALGSRVFTSNVDGQFQKAGFLENHIHECHGSIHHLQCMQECVAGVWSASAFSPEIDSETCHLINDAPRCIACGGVARPNILMFSDWNWVAERKQVQHQQETQWFDSVANSLCNIAIVEMGAGTAIPSVRHFSHRISREYGARIVRINPRESNVPSNRDVDIPLGALEGLQGINAAWSTLRVGV